MGGEWEAAALEVSREKKKAQVPRPSPQHLLSYWSFQDKEPVKIRRSLFLQLGGLSRDSQSGAPLGASREVEVQRGLPIPPAPTSRLPAVRAGFGGGPRQALLCSFFFFFLEIYRLEREKHHRGSLRFLCDNRLLCYKETIVVATWVGGDKKDYESEMCNLSEETENVFPLPCKFSAALPPAPAAAHNIHNRRSAGGPAQGSHWPCWATSSHDRRT